MMKKWQIVLLMILAVIAVLLILFHKLVWLIGCNLFQPALPLDENAEWTGGTYNRVYYGESEAQMCRTRMNSRPFSFSSTAAASYLTTLNPARRSLCTVISATAAMPAPA